MDWITTILGLLLVLIPAIGKVIEKRLQKAGKTGQAENVKKIIEIFDTGEDGGQEDETVSAVPDDIMEGAAVPEPVSVVANTGFRNERTVGIREERAVAGDESDEDITSGRKIDLRNLVIYSEIMKPKFES